MSGHLIRFYDERRLLYIASAGERNLSTRLRNLRGEPWWALADHGRTTIRHVEGDVRAAAKAAIEAEQPRYYRRPDKVYPYMDVPIPEAQVQARENSLDRAGRPRRAGVTRN